MDHRARIRLSSCTMSSKKLQFHARNLDFFDKSNSLAEDLDGKNDDDDDEDFKLRRRHSPAKATTFTPSAPPTVAALPPPVVTDEIRKQLGLAQPITTIEYDRLLLSLQSPLPNEQDMAISVCTLLSNDTRHALKFQKCPAVMEILLAHAGIFNHCNTRILMEEIYEKGRGFNIQDFWKNTIPNSDVRELLCECSLERYQNGVGIVPSGPDDLSFDDLADITDKQDVPLVQDDEEVKSELVQSGILDQSLVSVPPSNTSVSDEDSESRSALLKSESEPVPLHIVDASTHTDLTQEEETILEKVTGADETCQSAGGSGGDGDTLVNDAATVLDQESSQMGLLEVNGNASCGLLSNDDNDAEDEFLEEIKPPGVEKEVLWDLLDKDVTASNVDCEPCCPRCPCQRQPTIFDTPMKEDEVDVLALEKLTKVTEQIGQRIQQVSSIIRNLSFDKENAVIMGRNSSILRFILVTANCSYGALSQLSLDTLGNIARYMYLEDPLENPYFGMVLSLVIDGICSIDRFRCMRSLETVREWCREESNEGILSPLMDSKFFRRLCDLLTLSDIMLIVYTLECILSITNTGLEDICNKLARVTGAVDTLVSLVTVEAQSYGPTGCIQMRVVETVVGPSAYLHLLRANAQGTPDSQTVPAAASCPSQTMAPVVQSESFPLSVEAQNKALLLPPALVASVSPQILNTAVDRQSPVTFQTVQPPPPSSPTVSPPTTYIKPIKPVASQPVPLSIVVVEPRPPVAHQPATVTVLANSLKPVQGAAPITTTLHNGNYSVQADKSVPDTGMAKLNPLGDKTVFSFNPEVNVTPAPGAVNEKAWVLLWVKAAFEQVSGCSIEQEKMYRMYCSARKDSTLVVSMEDFISCVKEAYGAGIGPVIKNFGGNQLSFLDGLRPTMTVTSVGNGISGQSNVAKISNSDATPVNRVETRNEQNSQTNAVEQYIPPRELKTTSPILKATLSRPPKSPKTSPSKKQKVTRGKKCHIRKDESRSSIPNPTSSVIRSLLASKVTQRQQKKQQLSDSKQKTPPNKTNEKNVIGKKSLKVNGMDPIFKTEAELSSASSSLHSGESMDFGKANPPLSFQGILQNGLTNSEPITASTDENGRDELPEGVRGKGMLVDLLERKVVPRDNVNGLVGSREIRISDRGLELVDHDGTPWKSPVSNASSDSPTTNHISTNADSNPGTNSSTTASVLTNSTTKCHAMTFYSASEGSTYTANNVNKREDQTDGFAGNSDQQSVVLMSGGGKAGESASENEQDPKETVDINMDDEDLLEKFNEISDLIVVPPEQLQGLKRPKPADEKIPAEEPPVKKKAADPTTQYAFARPLVFSAGQQILLQTSNHTGSLHGAKVFLSRPTSASGDQQQQAYLILQTQQPISQATASTTPTIKISTLGGIPRIPISTTSLPVSSISSNSVTSNENSSKIQPTSRVEMPGLTSSVPVTKPPGSAVPADNLMPQQLFMATKKSQEQLDSEIPYLCEWAGCGLRFLKQEQMLTHALQTHAPPTLTEAIRCDWQASGCDGLYRKRFSLMTHLQDRHCSKAALDMSLYRRKNKIEPPPPPQTPINHLGYAPNAAFHAIRRHALQFSNPKELMDDVEGPVTKSIRLTSALILKNLCNYSPTGRRSLRRHESHLASVAMSNVESARTISQLLFDMNELGT